MDLCGKQTPTLRNVSRSISGHARIRAHRPDRSLNARLPSRASWVALSDHSRLAFDVASDSVLDVRVVLVIVLCGLNRDLMVSWELDRDLRALGQAEADLGEAQGPDAIVVEVLVLIVRRDSSSRSSPPHRGYRRHRPSRRTREDVLGVVFRSVLDVENVL